MNRHGEDAEEILELLQDPEGISALLDLTTAKLLVTFEQTGDLRCVDLALKCLKEALKTPKSKVEVGEEGEEDPAERIVKKLELKIEVRENVSDKPRES